MEGGLSMRKEVKRFLIALIVFIAIAAALILEFALLDISAAWVIALIVITGAALIISASIVMTELTEML